MDAAEMRNHVAGANAKVTEGQGSLGGAKDTIDDALSALNAAKELYEEGVNYYAAISDNELIVSAIGQGNEGIRIISEAINALVQVQTDIDTAIGHGNSAIEFADSYAAPL